MSAVWIATYRVESPLQVSPLSLDVSFFWLQPQTTVDTTSVLIVRATPSRMFLFMKHTDKACRVV
jgi:hypothetical protein